MRGSRLTRGSLAAPGKGEAERLACTAQECLRKLWTWSAVLPRTVQILLDVCFIDTRPAVVGATLVVARGWAGTRPAPTGTGLTKQTSSRVTVAAHLPVHKRLFEQ